MTNARPAKPILGLVWAVAACLLSASAALRAQPLPTSAGAGKQAIQPPATWTVASNGAIGLTLAGSGAPPAEVAAALGAIEEDADVANPRGAKITLTLAGESRRVDHLLSVRVEAEPSGSLTVERQAGGGYRRVSDMTASAPATVSRPKIILGEVRGSPFLSAVEAGASPEAARDALAMLSRRLDLTRDIAPGARFTLLVELAEDGSGGRSPVRFVEVETLEGPLRLFVLAGRGLRAQLADGQGRLLSDALLRTPVDATRISSTFGPRLHPLLGYTRMHQGVDFAAPTGSPIYAAGDGRIEAVGWSGGYGRRVILAHGDRTETLYGHMSAFAAGLWPGAQVRQGQVIGYVGMSGEATGPHLHFEVRRDGRPVDPQAGDALAAGVKLADPGQIASIRNEATAAGLTL